ncbi:FAD-dependent oxidoreductase [Cytophaga hutchinsonii]|uniref:Flavin-dependent monooxygenase n=1 Tax=Cytophaga hutchinsonii (strain ATCC 33406 / DSM 1761 / CIP 103989 / NBRC 15051 / NCIMB 9469 / D465) TaxID=269798 RepID=A0A6N4SSA5_CYTH3|nr:NAD(P)/FAD-dependent oxidoreductase [Cytophaga hutchinsonii]ABG59190.1 monooxygenase; possible 2-polyprenyl-6-methoxyphenol hydroxylase [Cytophaga hutchinsonii ATCC 33406]SFX34597.1 2-polyprenyl-6-methoxyphenol hydroxylase [Cytophaga hutchinsonii ATCC 33406]
MEQSAINTKKIAIVGGGPGGLTLARLLQKKGADVHVYERDLNKDARVQGATLDLHEESGLAALEEAGLMDAFRANYRPGADALRIVDKHATIFFDEAFAGDADTLQRPEIDRGPLRKILLESLLPNTVVWDSHLRSIEKAGEGWRLNFYSGMSAAADIVIAADGANSKIRAHITPLKPFYSGITIVEGFVYDSAQQVPAIHELVNGGKVFAMADSKTLIVSSKGDGSLVFYAGVHAPENWVANSGIDFKNAEEVRTWFKETFADWNPLWFDLFDKAEPDFVVRPQYCMLLDQSWEALPDLTMLGDAAHVMPPYAGEGVNMAMLDALELSRCLYDPSLPTAQLSIAAYERQMNARFAEIGTLTMEQTASLHSETALQNLLAMFERGID